MTGIVSNQDHSKAVLLLQCLCLGHLRQVGCVPCLESIQIVVRLQLLLCSDDRTLLFDHSFHPRSSTIDCTADGTLMHQLNRTVYPIHHYHLFFQPLISCILLQDQQWRFHTFLKGHVHPFQSSVLQNSGT